MKLTSSTLPKMILCVLLVSCAARETRAPLPLGPLSEQILVMRKDFKGLTHGHCAEMSSLEKCTDFRVVEYDLELPHIRGNLRELDFVCRIGNKRYTICKDEPGFCHKTYKRETLFSVITLRGEGRTDYIAQSEKDRLLSLGVTCFNPEKYPQLELE